MNRIYLAAATGLSLFFAGCSSCGTNPVGNEESFTVGGQVTGLVGTGLTLQLNGADEVAISADGPFSFPTRQLRGTAIAVTVKTQPNTPSQTCTVTQPTGTVEQDVADVAVACVTNSFKVGGTVMGLQGMGLQLQLNDSAVLDVAQDGAFQFPTAVASGQTFTVTVTTQPTSPAQLCEVIGGSGTIAGGDVQSIAVNCSTQSFAIGGTVTGLVGAGLVLQNNGGDDVAVNANGTFAFPTPVQSGGAFAVTVKTQPASPVQTCSVSSGTGTVGNGNVTTVAVVCATDAFAVGGTVTGLQGMGLVLQNNLGDNLPVTSDGSFTFAAPVASGAGYSITVATQPTNVSQTCVVSNGTGAVVDAAITDVQVTCTTNTYAVGGTVTGLLGANLVLRNNGGDDLAITADGAFTFSTPVESGAPFEVTVETQPASPFQTCVVTGGSGTVVGADVTSVAVNCTTNAYTVGGTISGLQGTGLQLSINGGTPVAVTANGTYAFPVPVESGATYSVVISAQPENPWQSCTLVNSTGSVTNADVTNVDVACVTNSYTVGGTVTGLAGGGLVLRNNGGDDLTVSANGAFTFATPILSGQSYAVTAFAQPTNPWQTCTVSTAAGTITNGDITNVLVTCTTNEYLVGGTVSGLAGTLVLQNNAGDNLTLTANGAYAFATKLQSGATYSVTVLTQPGTPSQTCTVANASGTVSSANVGNVNVSCVTNTYAIGGTVAGLAGSGLVLQNNLGDDLAVTANGAFTFATPVASGQTFSVTVKSQPTSPWQQCTVTGGAGTVGASNVSSVSINCTTNSYTVGGTVSGLAGSGLVLVNNGGNDLAVSGNGSFAFSTPVPSGQGYAVAVKTQPTNPWQTCAVTNGAGTVGSANVTSVQVACTTNTYFVRVNVQGLAGSGLVVQKNGGDNLAISSNGLHTFATKLASGAAYNITVLTQPSNVSQTCTASAGQGTMAGADLTVNLTCTTNSYTVGGTVSGLSGSGLVLQRSGGNNLAISSNGAFTFPAPVPSGTGYTITVLSHPTSQYCAVANATGTVTNANVTNVTVSCSNSMGTVRDVNGVVSPLFYVLCGSGAISGCTQSVAESSCVSIGKKLISHASDGTSSVVSLGATDSCQWSISYFTNTAPTVAGKCLVGMSNVTWSNCCGYSTWHGNTVQVPLTLGQQFGFVNSINSGYNSSLANVSGTQWGCYATNQAAAGFGSCTQYYVACK